jgi:DNA-binding transcriptional MerR regulator
MRPSEAANLLKIPASTIRTWTLQYQEFLSPTGGGGTGRWRSFNDIDLRILHHIDSLKRSGATGEEVVQALRHLQSMDWQDLPPLPDAPQTANFPVVPAAAAHAALDSERRSLLREIVTLQQNVENLASQLAEEQAARRADNERLLRELTEKERRLAETETLLKLYESGRLKPPQE